MIDLRKYIRLFPWRRELVKVLGVLHPAQHHVADVERPLLDVLNVVTPEILEIVCLVD